MPERVFSLRQDSIFPRNVTLSGKPGGDEIRFARGRALGLPSARKLQRIRGIGGRLVSWDPPKRVFVG
jgi:hypothetical protein